MITIGLATQEEQFRSCTIEMVNKGQHKEMLNDPGPDDDTQETIQTRHLTPSALGGQDPEALSQWHCRHRRVGSGCNWSKDKRSCNKPNLVVLWSNLWTASPIATTAYNYL